MGSFSDHVVDVLSFFFVIGSRAKACQGTRECIWYTVETRGTMTRQAVRRISRLSSNRCSCDLKKKQQTRC
ncbi:hypothetical protein BJV78DRAFT_1196833 [Lactifluus subvellereus]|nr:hypothetical protein BJV78DRAFT_1196833 [Lactifluus subvellereus]